jgi:hypothetical protein
MARAPSSRAAREAGKMSFGLYILGFVIAVIGLVIGATYLHIPARWITVGALVLLGIAVTTGVSKTRNRDPS